MSAILQYSWIMVAIYQWANLTVLTLSMSLATGGRRAESPSSGQRRLTVAILVPKCHGFLVAARDGEAWGERRSLSFFLCSMHYCHLWLWQFLELKWWRTFTFHWCYLKLNTFLREDWIFEIRQGRINIIFTNIPSENQFVGEWKSVKFLRGEQHGHEDGYSSVYMGLPKPVIDRTERRGSIPFFTAAKIDFAEFEKNTCQKLFSLFTTDSQYAGPPGSPLIPGRPGLRIFSTSRCSRVHGSHKKRLMRTQNTLQNTSGLDHVAFTNLWLY
jgi:hypothetical protein